MAHIRDDGHLVPDHRDIDDRYDPPTPADEGFDPEYERRCIEAWHRYRERGLYGHDLEDAGGP
jgi:hypothetical protein